MQPGVGEGLAERAELSARLRLPVGIGHGPPVRGVEPLVEDALELWDVGLAESTPEVARRGHAVSREDADAEAQDRVLAGALGVAVLRGRVLVLDRLEAQVGIAEVGARPGAGSHEVAHHDRHLRDEIRADRSRHAGSRAQRAWKSSTQTDSPAATSPRSSSMTMKQLAAVIEVRMPEPWGPVVRTSQRSLS